MIKMAMGVEYNGSNYYGWQVQYNKLTIQGCLEDALSKVANEPIKIFCAGRTDSGVHAVEQIIHFITSSVRNDNCWVRGVNYYLPFDIVVHWAVNVSYDFHARFKAVSRRYCYCIYNYPFYPAILSGLVLHCNRLLNLIKMNNASRCLLGEHNFISFSSSGENSKTFFRRIYHLKIFRCSDKCVIIDIKANSFLYRMVRNIVGNLIAVGCGIKSESWIESVLLSKSRKKSFFSVKSAGLYLVEVKYPILYLLPSLNKGLFFSSFFSF